MHINNNCHFEAFLVANQVNWSESFEAFDKVLKDLESSNSIFKLENWYEDFKEYSNTHFGTSKKEHFANYFPDNSAYQV